MKILDDVLGRFEDLYVPLLDVYDIDQKEEE